MSPTASVPRNKPYSSPPYNPLYNPPKGAQIMAHIEAGDKGVGLKGWFL